MSIHVGSFCHSTPKAPPNPSIEATNNGGQRLRTSSKVVPPLFAPHLKRSASLKLVSRPPVESTKTKCDRERRTIGGTT